MSNIHSDRRRLLASLGVVTTGVVAGCSGTADDADPTNESGSAPDRTETAEYVVSPDGADDNEGTQTSPLATVSEGLARAQPGETIRLQPGEYVEPIFTVRDGKPDDPITITGSEDAVIRPPPETYSTVTIRHDHIHLRGMTINGLIDPDRKFDDWKAWAGNCVQINPVSRADQGVEYVRGAVVEPARAGNTRRALIQTSRIRDAVIGGFKVIGPTGMKYDPRVANQEIGHVREVVYIGAPADQYKSPDYPYDTPERSRNIRVHHIDNSEGHAHNDFVEVKPGCTDVTIEYCTDRNAGHNSEGIVGPAIPISGNDCAIRWNDIGNCPSPIGFNSWEMDGKEWGKNNEVYGNYLHGFAAGAINYRNREGVETGPEHQKTVCGNRIERGDPPIEPWVPEANGFDGQVADRRGQGEVTIRVGAGPNGHQFDPPAVIVDPGTTISWKWVEGSGAHYVVSRVRVTADPETVPDLIEAPYSTTETLEIPSMKRYACYNHHETGMRCAVVIAGDDAQYESARVKCDPSIPEGREAGHAGGDEGSE